MKTGSGKASQKFRRVVLPLDPDSLDEESIRTVARFAQAFDAELDAYFVKTTDLYHMAALPFETIVISRSGRRRVIDADSLNRSLEQLAGRARALLSRSVAKRTRWTFSVVDGPAPETTDNRAAQTDVIAICRKGPQRVRAPSIEGDAPSLFIGRNIEAGRPVAVLYGGNTQTLVAGHKLAQAFDAPLIVYLAASRTNRSRMRQNARRWLARRSVPFEIVDVPEDRLASLRIVTAQSPSIVVLEKGPADDERIEAILGDQARLLIPAAG